MKMLSCHTKQFEVTIWASTDPRQDRSASAQTSLGEAIVNKDGHLRWEPDSVDALRRE
jgi:hypothetical protein